MRATYQTLEGDHGVFEAGAIIPQPMEKKDGFTLLGFKDWEAVHEEKLSSAITELASFELSAEMNRIGFHDKD